MDSQYPLSDAVGYTKLDPDFPEWMSAVYFSIRFGDSEKVYHAQNMFSGIFSLFLRIMSASQERVLEWLQVDVRLLVAVRSRLLAVIQDRQPELPVECGYRQLLDTHTLRVPPRCLSLVKTRS